MKITLIPQRNETEMQLERHADALIINGMVLDLAGVTEGAPRAAEDLGCGWLTGAIERVDGELNLSLILPHGACAPDETKFPNLLHVTEDGPVTLPEYGAAVEEQNPDL